MVRTTTETTADDGVASSLATASPAEPTLLLAFTDEGRRGNERHRLGPEGVELGRGATLFPGGPLDDGKLSRSHAEVGRDGDGFALLDRGSRNGTFVNGELVGGKRRLAPGDVIRVGGTIVIFAAMAEGSAAIVAPSLLGPSVALLSVRRAIAAAARDGRAAVLVSGETGSGKELVAGALHEESRRSGKLVALNCGALTEGTLASELFGHVRGAFTGASGERPGLFRAAHRGTLFLDEVGEIPPGLQPALLRVLEARAVRPVGGVDDLPVDVLIVAATNRDLVAESRAGRFRADLYARLSQCAIHLPPLRERREDLPRLIEHLLSRGAGVGRRMAARFYEALLLHPWPLNARGIANVLSTAVMTHDPSSPLDLTPEVTRVLDDNRAIGEEIEPEEGEEPGEERAPPSLEQLQGALARFHGKVAAAARHLGCSRKSIYQLAKLHRLDLDGFRAPRPR